MGFETPVYLDTYKFKQGATADENLAAGRHKVAMFLTGFIMLTPHRIAVLCAPHIVKRFHLPLDKIPLFIYKIHNPMELASFVGTVIQVLLSALFATISTDGGVQNKLAPGHKGYSNNHPTSTYTVTKLTDCTYKIARIGGRGNDTTVTNYNPGGSNHNELKDNNFPPTGLSNNDYQLAQGASSTHNYSGWTGDHADAVITNCKRVASIICGWFMFFTSIFTFIFFISGDDYGYLGQFYWSVIIMAFANGIYSSFSFGVNVNAAIYAVGLPLSGFFTFVFHNCCRFLSNRFNWEDYDYTFVKLLIISTMLIQFITAAWWTMDQVFQLGSGTGPKAGSIIPNNSSIGELFGIPRTPNPSGGNTQGADANQPAKRALQAWSHWSPILMLSMSLGTVYAFYPAITPYQLMDVEDANNTDFYIQFISAIPTLVIGVLDEVDCGPGSGDGYNSDNDNEKSSITKWKMYNWYDRPAWNCFWIAAIPYVLCLHIFITMIHFPDGFIATFLHSKPRLLQAICVSFNFWQEILEIVGFSAAGKQSNPKAVTHDGTATGTPKEQIAYNGHVGMVNNFLFLFTMAITMFVGDGYLILDNTIIYLYWVYGVNYHHIIIKQHYMIST